MSVSWGYSNSASSLASTEQRLNSEQSAGGRRWLIEDTSENIPSKRPKGWRKGPIKSSNKWERTSEITRKPNPLKVHWKPRITPTNWVSKSTEAKWKIKPANYYSTPEKNKPKWMPETTKSVWESTTIKQHWAPKPTINWTSRKSRGIFSYV